MTHKLGVVMDPISSIHVKKDSTLAMLLSAQESKFSLFYMEQKDLFLKNDKAYATMRPLTVYDNEKQWYTFQKEITQPLSDLDVILMRKDPPVDMTYIHTTQLLDHAKNAGVLVMNHPESLRHFNEKLLVTWFPEYSPPTLVSADSTLLRHFLHEYKDIILKPLNQMGGRSVFHVKEKDPNLSVILETMTSNNTQLIIAQKYLPDITQGDKRILLIDGKPVPYALARIPAPGETRGNLAAGAQGKAVKLSKRDHDICDAVGSFLVKNGIFFAGLDVIGDYLTEINITSPTCIRELEAQEKLPIAKDFIGVIEKMLS